MAVTHSGVMATRSGVVATHGDAETAKVDGAPVGAALGEAMNFLKRGASAAGVTLGCAGFVVAEVRLGVLDGSVMRRVGVAARRRGAEVSRVGSAVKRGDVAARLLDAAPSRVLVTGKQEVLRG